MTWVRWSRARTARILSTIALFVYAWSSMLPRISVGGFGLVFGSFASMASLLLFVVSFVMTLGAGWGPGDVTLADGVLRIVGGRRIRTVPVAQVESALVVARSMGVSGVLPTVELRLKGGDVVSFNVPSPQHAVDLVEALGFGSRGKRVTVELATPTRRWLHVLLGFGVLQAMTFASVLLSTVTDIRELGTIPIFLVPFVYMLFRKMVSAPRLTVGSDGVEIARGLRKRRFIPRAELRRVHVDPWTKNLAFETTTETLPVRGVALDVERRTALAQLAHERLLAAAPANERSFLFDRGGRSVDEWKKQLRAVGDAGYRNANVTADDAASILASAGASAEQRVGAAIMLRAAGEPPARIRVAAESAIDEHLRVALEAVAEDDDAGVEQALSRMTLSR